MDFKDEYAVKYKMLRYCMDYTKNICGTDWKVYKEGKLKEFYPRDASHSERFVQHVIGHQ